MSDPTPTQHERYEINAFGDGCRRCGEEWPCRTLLLERIEELEAENMRLRELMTGDQGRLGPVNTTTKGHDLRQVMNRDAVRCLKCGQVIDAFDLVVGHFGRCRV
jgi:hypothetical protein